MLIGTKAHRAYLIPLDGSRQMESQNGVWIQRTWDNLPTLIDRAL